MKKTLIVARYEFLRTAKRKAFIFTALFLPLLMVFPTILVTNYSASAIETESLKKVGFIDNADILSCNDNHIEYFSIDEAKQALKNNEVAYFFIIGSDYLQTGRIKIYSIENKANPAVYLSGLEAYLKECILEQANISDEFTERIKNPYFPETVTLDTEGNEKEENPDIFAFLLPYALTILLMMGVFTSTGYLMEGIGEEKENRSGELLLSSISPDQLLRGKILGHGLAGLVQVGIWMGFVLLIGSFSLPPEILSEIRISWIFGLAAVYFILGYFLFAVSIACTASLASSAKEAQQTSGIFMLMGVMPMILSQAILVAPDSGIAKALTYFPYTAPFITMMRIPLTEVSPLEIGVSLGIMALTILVLARLSAKIFRMGMLMHGKKAGIRQILGFLREK